MDYAGKNTEVGCHFLLQGIFPNQGSNPHLLHWKADSLPLSLREAHIIVYYTTIYTHIVYYITYSICILIYIVCIYIYILYGASRVAQMIICLQFRKRGFDPWVGKMPWRRKWQAVQYCCLKNPMDRGAWGAGAPPGWGSWRAESMGLQGVRHDWATEHI